MAEPVNNSPSDGANDTAGADKSDVKETKGGKTFTQEQLGQKLSEERKKLREEFEKEKADALASEKAEWERQSKLTEEQRAKEAQEAQRKELEKREHDITMRERRSEAIERLNEKGISTKLVDFVVDADSDKTERNIEVLEKEFNKAVEEGVKAKLAGKTPTDKGSTTQGGKSTDGSANNGIISKDGYRAF